MLNNRKSLAKFMESTGTLGVKNMFKKILFILLIIIGSNQTWAADDYVIYYHNDALGSPVAATDSAGQVLWKEHYHPYGEKAINDQKSFNEKLGYTGKSFDRSTGLSYYGARYYDPVIGRFMGIDPVGFQEGNVHSFNRYAYANNNPLAFTDPDGRFPLSLSQDYFSSGKVARDFGAGFVNAAVNFIPGKGIYDGVGDISQGHYLLGVAAIISEVPAFKGARAINGAKLSNLSPGEIKRIQNAADRIQTNISVVGGRAAVKGGRSKNADFDFVIDANHRTRSKISNSLPGAGNLMGEGVRKNQDIFRKIDNPSQPQIIFSPRKK